MKSIDHYNAVGPVLIAGDVTNNVLLAIKKLNRHVVIERHGSYIRVLVPLNCKLTKKAIEDETQSNFRLPDDLELIMPSFKGQFRVTRDEASWTFESEEQDKSP